MVARTTRTSTPISCWRACRFWLQRAVDKLSVVVRDRYTASPTLIGDGRYDCALSSLYWAAPTIPEPDLVVAFNFAADTWPYGGITNKEFSIALKYLRVDSVYSTDVDTLEALLAAKPAKCVALLHGHFIPIVDGMIVGSDAQHDWSPDTHVYCHWTFTRRIAARGKSIVREPAQV